MALGLIPAPCVFHGGVLGQWLISNNGWGEGGWGLPQALLLRPHTEVSLLSDPAGRRRILSTSLNITPNAPLESALRRDPGREYPFASSGAGHFSPWVPAQLTLYLSLLHGASPKAEAWEASPHDASLSKVQVPLGFRKATKWMETSLSPMPTRTCPPGKILWVGRQNAKLQLHTREAIV